MKKIKAQTSIEFLILIGFILFFFVIFFVAINMNMQNKIEQREELLIKEIAVSVQDEISLAIKSSDGYSREFQIPEKLGNKDYEINIIENMVYLRAVDNSIALALPVPEINGDLIKGTNQITKQNNEVYLNL